MTPFHLGYSPLDWSFGEMFGEAYSPQKGREGDALCPLM